MKAVLKFPMIVALTIEVLVNDMKPEIVDHPKMNPGTIAILNAFHVSRMRRRRTMTKSTTGQNNTR